MARYKGSAVAVATVGKVGKRQFYHNRGSYSVGSHSYKPHPPTRWQAQQRARVALIAKDWGKLTKAQVARYQGYANTINALKHTPFSSYTRTPSAYEVYLFARLALWNHDRGNIAPTFSRGDIPPTGKFNIDIDFNKQDIELSTLTYLRRQLLVQVLYYPIFGQIPGNHRVNVRSAGFYVITNGDDVKVTEPFFSRYNITKFSDIGSWEVVLYNFFFREVKRVKCGLNIF